ncbi:MAG: DNA repair protein RadA [Candidatus Merdivicinus sp.]
MLKSKEIFVCRECGYESIKWLGKCPACGEWNTLEQATPLSSLSPSQAGKPASVSKISEIQADEDVRFLTGISEFDRVLGGGLVRGSIILLGGDPGIGKSTLLLQVCQTLSAGHRVLYVSGEESARQIKLRASRLHVSSSNLFVLSCGDMDTILATIRQEKPEAVVIDSIQTMTLSSVASAAGSVTQVRECANVLLNVAKENDISIILVGHVTKEGNLAGPRVLEHIVDAVFHFEGEQHHAYRILRAVKNRYGATNEIAVFEMRDAGLVQVENPSEMLLSERPASVSGSCVVCVLEGSRPILAEVQALITKSGFPTPRRMATGFDYNRMSMLLAVLEKRAGYFFGTLDAYINVVGGLRLDEPACDLPIALAMVSGLRDRPIPADLIAIGEIGLGGEIRSVIRLEDRIREAERMGFQKVLIPASSLEKINPHKFKIRLIGASNIMEALRALAETSPKNV